MRVIHVNEDILLEKGLNEFEIESERDLELSFRAVEDCEVFVRVKSAKSLTVRTFTAQYQHVSFLFWNECTESLNVREEHEVLKDADLNVAYGEVNGAATKRNTYVALRESGAHALVSSASLVSDEKNYVIQVVNYAPHTYGDMKNYAVVLKGGRLSIDAIGKIVKGASASESHQTSRALSFEEGQHSLIVPELLIDEDDVQASHAMSIGSVDPDHLYYLETRGLTLSQCTALISAGYLMPVTETIENETLKQVLKEEMERKIEHLC